MAKKKQPVELDLNKSPMRDEVITGDVVIQYEGIDRFGTSETNQIDIKTAETICWHDITVDYHKPEPAPVTIPVYYQIPHADEVFAQNIVETPGAHLETVITTTAINLDLSAIIAFAGDDPADTAPFDVLSEWDDETGTATIYGYMPGSLPDGCNRILIDLNIK
ncbi:MAG: hypothetical protein J6V38_02805 [Kiritimatiellae bacterium]|nr:hypothetical protein [Kiritimatiellia bacterium]